jgi:hypothetical protein
MISLWTKNGTVDPLDPKTRKEKKGEEELANKRKTPERKWIQGREITSAENKDTRVSSEARDPQNPAKFPSVLLGTNTETRCNNDRALQVNKDRGATMGGGRGSKPRTPTLGR